MNSAAPTLSIVTPSFNQAAFLEQTILSVHADPSVAVEHVIIDGGSTDGSVEIIRRHEARLAGWVSEPDGGQYDAIAKGFQRTTGEVMAWLNSDDQYTPWALSVVQEIFAQLPEVEWLTTRWPLRWDERGRAVRCAHRVGYAREAFWQGEYRPGQGRAVIQQESTFWRRSLWERAGGRFDSDCGLAGDFELWARFFKMAELYAADTPLGGFRVQGAQRSAVQRARYLAEVESAWQKHGGRERGIFERVRRALGGRSAAKICRFNKETHRWVIERVAV